MSKVKFGVIGAGGIAYRKTIPGMLKADNCELVAVMDVANIENIAKEFGVSKAYTNEADLLADSDVEAVYIASPVNLHAKQIEMCAKAGKHVLCEKPLTLTMDEAVASLKVCEENNVFLQEGYMMKFHGAHQKIKEIIESGKLGRITYMRAQLSCWYPPIPGAWRQDPKTGGGGSLFDMGTHLYDLLEYFAGPVKKLSAITGNLVHDYKSEDTATTLLGFENGAQATIDSSFSVPDESTRTRLEIYGSKGSIFTEGTIGQSTGGKMEGIFGLGEGGYDAEQNKDVVREFADVEFDKLDPYSEECAYFADCILNNRKPELNSGEHAIHILDMAIKAYESSKDNKVITF